MRTRTPPLIADEALNLAEDSQMVTDQAVQPDPYCAPDNPEHRTGRMLSRPALGLPGEGA